MVDPVIFAEEDEPAEPRAIGPVLVLLCGGSGNIVGATL